MMFTLTNALLACFVLILISCFVSLNAWQSWVWRRRLEQYRLDHEAERQAMLRRRFVTPGQPPYLRPVDPDEKPRRIRAEDRSTIEQGENDL